MAKKLKVENENESVVSSREDKIDSYAFYSLVINATENAKELEALKEGKVHKKVREKLKSGKYKGEKEALLSLLEEYEKAPIYAKSGYNSPEEAIDSLKSVVFGKAASFVDTREPLLCSAILPYIEELLLAGMRAKICICTWWRAVNYGFSIEPYNDKKKPTKHEDGEYYDIVDLPYRSLNDMSETDRKAFKRTALDMYYELETLASYYHASEKMRPTKYESEEVDLSFKPYPIDGFKASELAEQHEVTRDELYESWEFEIELYFPFLVYRFDEAVYYALKYKGNEYRGVPLGAELSRGLG